MDPLTLATHGLATVLHCQDGVIRRDQALAAGITEPQLAGLLRRGRWERLLPRVFGVGVDSLDPRVRIRAAWLWAGEDAVIGCEAAAWWLGVRRDPPGLVQVFVPPARRMTAQPNLRVIRATVDPMEVLTRHHIAVTAAERTCLDLIRQQRGDHLTTALRLKRTSPAQLEKSVAQGRGRRGQVLAREAVLRVADNPWSDPEKTLHQLLRGAGISGWRANVPVRTRRGFRYPDASFEPIKLAVEVDGHKYHSSAEAKESDLKRQNLLIDEGWTLLRFSASQVETSPAEVVDTVRRNINRLNAAR